MAFDGADMRDRTLYRGRRNTSSKALPVDRPAVHAQYFDWKLLRGCIASSNYLFANILLILHPISEGSSR